MRHSPVRCLLLPFSLLYRLVTELRNWLFDNKILPQRSYPPFLLVVGNLSTGGTGKTPHVIALAEALKNEFRVAVLSRGYRRKSKGFRWVSQADHPDVSGDEPLEIKQALPDLPVAVDGNRRRGIQRMLAELTPAPEVILMDDGFQHRFVRPDFSLILTRSTHLFTDDYLLPAGNLREHPGHALQRADAVCVTYADMEDTVDTYRTKAGLGKSRHLMVSHPHYSFAGEPSPAPESHILLVTALAGADEILRYLNTRFATVTHLAFPDHHRYREKDIHDIIRIFSRMEGTDKTLVTTGKDWTKLQFFPALSSLPCQVLRMQVAINNHGQNEIIHHVRDYVTKNQGKR